MYPDGCREASIRKSWMRCGSFGLGPESNCSWHVLCRRRSVGPLEAIGFHGSLPDLGWSRVAYRASPKIIIRPGAPYVTSDNLDEVARSLVTDEERGLVAEGVNALVWIQMGRIAEEDLSEGERAALDARLRAMGATAGWYLDISVYKQVGNEETRIRKTPTPLRLDVTVPDELRHDGRTHCLIRCHEDEATVLASTEGVVIDAQSDRFPPRMCSPIRMCQVRGKAPDQVQGHVPVRLPRRFHRRLGQRPYQYQYQYQHLFRFRHHRPSHAPYRFRPWYCRPTPRRPRPHRMLRQQRLSKRRLQSQRQVPRPRRPWCRIRRTPQLRQQSRRLALRRLRSSRP